MSRTLCSRFGTREAASAPIRGKFSPVDISLSRIRRALRATVDGCGKHVPGLHFKGFSNIGAPRLTDIREGPTI
ncbi:hypothetical protein [Bradyrhizobium sp. CCBAU 11434]|uniref:hypothetical protein n=1 Tax=Bradyrhizobium sp. CCBAU 11434 TaxID=1630885 RepID=UPI00230615E4|nr:hypothetical protein [Bradyrhizobium sp. CCBAU 11434]